MKPSQFNYVRPATLEQAIAALAAAAGEGKIIAGGQSLMPMMNFRLVSPALLIDINRIKELDFLEEQAGGLRIGALTRHHTLETSSLVKRLFPVLSAAMAHVAHLAIRNRGTIGGSISHADPAAELPMMMLLLEARITAVSPRGKRVIDAADFFLAALTSDVQEDEIVTEISLPALPAGAGWAFEEVARRPGDYALAAVGVILTQEQGRAAQVRIGVMGVGDTPMRLPDAEAVLNGQACDEQSLDAVVAAVRNSVQPDGDLHASGDYRRHLVGVLVRRAVKDAWKRAQANAKG
ncbi:xanthine dehydrogenase family protein subunit M [Lacisediminimonas sp.]|uniref:FAD binding domain-containing protein n=1 Tax=Lacisediminimonas sp. TaxID=3060582 RepID=UPI00272528FF|nr:xanthine dehydrogenase family protein subunit M [Lacisediminimonas sp.]MDO8300603.1 xanthine dehydrogenase family protein subunit M [Lacisediminimonas sp.]MDO9216053.1 xanthine dehydrogenase family protein subunit M [Lacisediminimonas sp.]